MENYNYMIEGKVFDVVMNASGCFCRTKHQLDILINNGFGTIITKTCTLEPNKGNPEPNFIEINQHNSINCLGMPNNGYIYYRDLLPEYKSKGITYIISMDASNWTDLKTMLCDYDKFITHTNNQIKDENTVKEFVEINASCPNKLDVITGKTSRIISYDVGLFETLLKNILSLELKNINIGIKLSPYIDKILLEQIANIILNYSGMIKYIVCGNSIPNGMIIDLKNDGKPLLSVKTGGISGTANRLIGVSNVYQFNTIFNSYFNDGKGCKPVIFGCGGIENDNDILEYLNAGAQSVQIGRVLYIHGVEHINTINNKLISKL